MFWAVDEAIHQAVDVNSWTVVISTVVNVGFAGAVGWYLLTRALPKMQADYLASMKEAGDAMDKREDRLRADNRESLKAVVDHCDREMQRRDDAMEKNMNVFTAGMNDVREVLEEVRDALRGIGIQAPRK